MPVDGHMVKMEARYAGTCGGCGYNFREGETIYWLPADATALCETCGQDDA